MPDHVKLTGTDHQIKRDADASSLIMWIALVNETRSKMPDQAIVMMINLQYTIPPLLKNFEIYIFDQLFNIHY